MGLVEESFSRLFPDRQFDFAVKLNFSGRFKPYNANVRRRGNALEFNLSSRWKNISEEIVIGLVQDLLLKILKVRGRTTVNVDLYNSFVRNLHVSAPKDTVHPLLLQSFNRVNSAFFNDLLECPNLVFGHCSSSKLATYDYHTDTVSVSRVFLGARPEIIDYLVYHELLHKKLKFRNRNNKAIHHGSEFRAFERQFPNQKVIEGEIERMVKSRV